MTSLLMLLRRHPNIIQALDFLVLSAWNGNKLSQLIVVMIDEG